MDTLILYIILILAVGAHVQACIVEKSECIYVMSCVNSVDSPWTKFSSNYRTHNYNYNYNYNVNPDYNYNNNKLDPSCESPYNYQGYKMYPVKLILKINENPSLVQTVPPSENDYVTIIVETLDLSDNELSQTPVIKSMENLANLNLSRNHLTTAYLSNLYTLSKLTEIDLSYNTINDIVVNNYPCVYKNLVKINLSHNYLVKVPDTIFDAFASLEILDLSYNYIDTLTQLTFEGIKKLTNLNLSNNRLANINSSLFRFNELKILNLSENKITELKVTDFEQLRKIETLDLSFNIIKVIDSDVFNFMIGLQNLDLSNNQLKEIRNDAFLYVQSLDTINLSNNKLKSLPKGLFTNKTINIFSVTENVLEGSIEKGMLDGINVTKLDLSEQNFTEIQDNAFNNLNSLSTLLLNSNNIKSLSNKCFNTLTNLQVLDLSFNKITNIDFNKEDLSNLKSFLLKNNRVTKIKYEQLQHLSSLEYLDLSNNLISQLEPRSFQSLRNLINLEINENPLNGTLESGTFDGLVSLPVLDISNNMLTTIQNASFKGMTRLAQLNLSTCEISELQYNTFVDTGYIETLDLSYNKLKEFSVNTSELVGLTTLFINNNLIKIISSTTLSGLSQLNKVILAHNIIDNIHNESFNNLIDLRYLDISYNENLNFNVDILKNNTNLNTLILSGLKTHLSFAIATEGSSVTELHMSNSSIRNISEMHLSSLTHLDKLDLSYNNISKLHKGDFSGISSLRYLDLSFNEISFIQPGAFKDNTLLNYLNISHNYLVTLGYGTLRGLIYLSILDMSYNKINDLQSERFYEVKSLSQLIVDSNRIDSINAEEFIGTSLSKLSIGDNPLPCKVLVKLGRSGIPFEISAIILDEHNNENVNGVTCNKHHMSVDTDTRPEKVIEDNSDVLTGLRNILYNLTDAHVEVKNNDIPYLTNISKILERANYIYDEKLSYLSNLTLKDIAANNNTNMMLNKIIQLLQSRSVPSTTTPVSLTEAVISTSTTTHAAESNESHINQTADVILYVNKIKKDLENNIEILKRNILNEVDSKFAFNNYETNLKNTESIPKIGQEKLVTNNESTKSLFTETCVALILFILLGLVLYKFYKSRMFVRNRFSLSTRELPSAMDNSAL